MKFLYIASHGPEDPTRATLPFQMAKGAKEAGHEAEIALMGDAVVLFQEGMAANVQGVGLPPLRELMQFARENGVRVFG